MAYRVLVRPCGVRLSFVPAICGCLLAVLLAGCSSGSHLATTPRAFVGTAAVTPSVAGSPARSHVRSVKSRRPDTRTPAPRAVQVVLAVEIASGKVIVQAQCAWCHALADAGVAGAAQPVAPALDGVGAKHGRAWLAAVLLDACRDHPKPDNSHCARAHGTVAALSPQQREQIVSYLLTLRS